MRGVGRGAIIIIIIIKKGDLTDPKYFRPITCLNTQ